MTTTAVPVAEVSAIDRQEAAALAAAENQKVADLIASLADEDWAKPTDCTGWDVRALAAHVLGSMEGFARFGEWVHQMRAGSKAAGDGPFVDGMTAVQVRERADLDTRQLVDRLVDVAPRSARARSRVPGALRRLPLKQEVAGATETWRMGYLLDVILTRDMWMHRVDLARATGRSLDLTGAHDGRLVADVVAEWARRHGRPFTLTLDGPAGGTFTQGRDGEQIALDAVELCRTLSGRATGAGLLTQEVPF
ncbi:MAG: uncharacterized protein JWM05_3399 [Acidimicrobiales bacterium]|nr:uncharacterized protein [Acidimicrobiales bacterium]